jgi:hypothetical protein
VRGAVGRFDRTMAKKFLDGAYASAVFQKAQDGPFGSIRDKRSTWAARRTHPW